MAMLNLILLAELLSNVKSQTSNPIIQGITDDGAFTSKDEWPTNDCADQNARLNDINAWCPETDNSWLQVDLGDEYVITQIGTKGAGYGGEWTTKYNLQYGLTTGSLVTYGNDPITANTNADTEVKLKDLNLIARYLKFYPLEHGSSDWYALRVEAYGYLYITPSPTPSPTAIPTPSPTNIPTLAPTNQPSITPTKSPSISPSKFPTQFPTKSPTNMPTISPTKNPTITFTKSPTNIPTKRPTNRPTKSTDIPTRSPTKSTAAVSTVTVDPTFIVDSNEQSEQMLQTGNTQTIVIFVSILCIAVICFVLIFTVYYRKKHKKAKLNRKQMEIAPINSKSINSKSSIVTGEVKEAGPGGFTLKSWLANLELLEYYNVFVANGFGDGQTTNTTLFELNNEDLMDMGITKVGHRKLILYHIKKKHSEDSNASDNNSTDSNSNESIYNYAPPVDEYKTNAQSNDLVPMKIENVEEIKMNDEDDDLEDMYHNSKFKHEETKDININIEDNEIEEMYRNHKHEETTTV